MTTITITVRVSRTTCLGAGQVTFTSSLLTSFKYLKKRAKILGFLFFAGAFFLQCVFLTELTMLLHFKSVRIVFLVFGCEIISLLAFGAGKNNLIFSH